MFCGTSKTTDGTVGKLKLAFNRISNLVRTPWQKIELEGVTVVDKVSTPQGVFGLTYMVEQELSPSRSETIGDHFIVRLSLDCPKYFHNRCGIQTQGC